MNIRLIPVSILVWALASCHSTEHETHAPDEHEGHQEAKISYSAYSTNFEVFAEAGVFVVGEKSNILSHFSTLPDFKAVGKGKITLTLQVEGTETSQTLASPTRPGIYSFDLQPPRKGPASLRFDIATDSGHFEIRIPGVTVYASDEEAGEAAERAMPSRVNATTFTKEQAWKIDFATALPRQELFGPVIHTTARVESNPEREAVISARATGMVHFAPGVLRVGCAVRRGQLLCTINGNDLADNNMAVRFAEAKSMYEKTKADYERAADLNRDHIVSSKDLLAAKNLYDQARAVFENLQAHFSTTGLAVNSPEAGFIKQVLVPNGAYVETGQAIAVLSQGNRLQLQAGVSPKYAAVLPTLKTATLRTLHDNRTYTLEELKGKVVSFGQALNPDNFQLPVYLEIENNGFLVPGSFVEVNLKCQSASPALVLPNTALMEDQGHFFVWVQVHPELFEKREVVPGGSDGINTEITRGLSSSERVVTRGAMMVKLAQASGALDAHSGHVH